MGVIAIGLCSLRALGWVVLGRGETYAVFHAAGHFACYKDAFMMKHSSLERSGENSLYNLMGRSMGVVARLVFSF